MFEIGEIVKVYRVRFVMEGGARRMEDSYFAKVVRQTGVQTYEVQPMSRRSTRLVHEGSISSVTETERRDLVPVFLSMSDAFFPPIREQERAV